MAKVALIGAGNMGGAMLNGWLAQGTLEAADVLVSEKLPDKAQPLANRHGVALADSVKEAAAASRILVLAVKPQDSAAVLEEVAQAGFKSDRTLISIAAGLTIAGIRKYVGGEPTVVRVMPNMAALVGAAVSAFAVDRGSGDFDRVEVEELLSAIGETVEVEEAQMNLVTAVSGSGPAYFFLMVEALQEAAVDLGLPEDVARLLARETLWGAAKVLHETGREADEMRLAVSSPGGTTVAALAVLEEESLRESMRKAVLAATNRAGELAT